MEMSSSKLDIMIQKRSELLTKFRNLLSYR